MLLQNTSSVVGIIAQLVAVGAVVGGPSFALFLRVKALELIVAQQAEKLKGMDGVTDRLTRIETLLEILVREAGH